MGGQHILIYQKQSHQVVENTCELSGIEQNNPNIGHCWSFARRNRQHLAKPWLVRRPFSFFSKTKPLSY
jgi:hypothetical protein